MLLSAPLLLIFQSLTGILHESLLENFELNKNTRTIIIYFNNETSNSFNDEIMSKISQIGRPTMLIDLDQNMYPEELSQIIEMQIGHEMIHIFLWKDCKTFIFEKWPMFAFIHNSDRVYFVFEDTHNIGAIQSFAKYLWHLRLLQPIIIYMNQRNETQMITNRLTYSENVEQINNKAEVLKEIHYENVKIKKRINLQNLPVTVFMVVRLPKVLLVDETVDTGRLNFWGRDGDITDFICRFYNASLVYLTTMDSFELKKNLTGIDDKQSNHSLMVVNDEIGPL